jgi:hypothetical protein
LPPVGCPLFLNQYTYRYSPYLVAVSILIRKSEGNRSLGEPRHTWDDSITSDLKQFGKALIGLIWHCIGTSG